MIELQELDLTPLPVAPLAPSTINRFDYASFAPADAEKARKAADTIRASIGKAKLSYFEAGRELTAIKDSIPHGEFGKWLRAEFDMTEKTAQNYMGAYRLYKENEIVSVLPPKVLYELASPSTPVEIKSEVIAQIKNGNVPSTNKIICDIADAKKKRADEAKKAAEEKKLQTEAERKAAEKKWKASAAYKEKKAKREAEEQAARDAKQAAELRAAQDAVAMLRDKLGADFPKFCELFARARWEFETCLKAPARDISVGAERVAA